MTVTRRAFGAVIALAVTACAPETTNPTASGPQPITELRIGLTAIGGERERAEILKGYEAYLEQRLGMPVRVYNASDYAGVAQAMEADQIELAFVGPSNYAGMALRMGDRIAPVLAPADASYYAILYVSAASPYRTLEDLRGKTLAFADVNSASGYLIPSSLLRQEGKDPAQFFGRTIFAGGHQQAIVAVMRGQADAGVTWSSLTGAPEAGYALGAPHIDRKSVV